MSTKPIRVGDSQRRYDNKADEREPPKGYKRTEVGVIPQDWDCCALTEVARLESGHTPSRRRPSYWNGSVPWVSLHDTKALEDSEITATSQTISEEGLANSSARLLPKGTVIFSRTATVGKSTVLGEAMATSQDFANYVCGPRIHNHYLVHLFRSMNRVWKRFMAGSIHNTIYMPVFKSLRIAVPPIGEQRAIAEVLSNLDALVSELDEMIRKKRVVKQAAMQQLLTGGIRLPGFDGDWITKRVEEIGSTYGGLTGKAKSDFGIGQSRYVTFLNVLENVVIKYEVCEAVRVSPSESQNRVRFGDILLNGTSETPGELAMAAVVMSRSEDLYLNSFCFGLRLLDQCGCDPLFLAYYFRGLPGRRMMYALAQGATRYNMSKSQFRSLSLLLPRQAEQVAIATVLSDMDAEIEALQARREKTIAIKQGTAQQLLTGRTRLLTSRVSGAADC